MPPSRGLWTGAERRLILRVGVVAAAVLFVTTAIGTGLALADVFLGVALIGVGLTTASALIGLTFVYVGRSAFAVRPPRIAHPPRVAPAPPLVPAKHLVMVPLLPTEPLPRANALAQSEPPPVASGYENLPEITDATVLVRPMDRQVLRLAR